MQGTGFAFMKSMKVRSKARFPLILLGSVAFHLAAVGLFYGSYLYGIYLKFGSLEIDDSGEARYTVEWLEDEHPPRYFCQRCIDDDETVDFAFDEGRDLERERVDLSITELSGTRAELAARAEELAFTWAMREPPPFVRDFIERYRAP